MINELGVRVDTQGRATRARGVPGKAFQERQRWYAAQAAQAAIDAAALSKAPPVKAAAATGAVVINIFAKPQAAVQHPPPQPQALGHPPGPPPPQQRALAQPPLRKPPPATLTLPQTKAPPVPQTSLEHDLFFANR